MKSLEILPEEYKEILSIDLQKDKKLALLVNVLAIVIAVLLAVPMNFYIPISTLFDRSKEFGEFMLQMGVLLLSMFVYAILHELVHGITMKFAGTKKVKYGFTGMYAFAGSDDYYDKKSYIIIALAPVVVWGIVLAVLNAFVPAEWFWVVYIIQIMNLSGAAGDYYVSFRFSKLPKDIWVHDCGTSMKVYSK